MLSSMVFSYCWPEIALRRFRFGICVMLIATTIGFRSAENKQLCSAHLVRSVSRQSQLLRPDSKKQE